MYHKQTSEIKTVLHVFFQFPDGSQGLIKHGLTERTGRSVAFRVSGGVLPVPPADSELVDGKKLASGPEPSGCHKAVPEVGGRPETAIIRTTSSEENHV